jgi:hypothetical protein
VLIFSGWILSSQKKQYQKYANTNIDGFNGHRSCATNSCCAANIIIKEENLRAGESDWILGKGGSLADFPATAIDPVNILARSFIGDTAPPPQASWLTLLSRGESLFVRRDAFFLEFEH